LLADWLLIGVLLALVAILARYNPEQGGLSGAAHIIDGDTVIIQQQSIRFLGIDAPEQAQQCQGKREIYACGRRATKHLRRLISGRMVYCEGWQMDVYDRLLATCYTLRTGKKRISLNEQMVLDGWALSYSSYPRQERSARKAKRGMWAGKFITPAEWRSAHNGRDDREVAFVASIWNWIKTLAEKALSCCAWK